MIRFFENYSLKQHNTFGLDAKAKYYFEFTEPEDLAVFLQSNNSWKKEKMYVLGQGSNTLFLKDFNGLIIHPNVPGMFQVHEDRQNIWMEAGAGESWDAFVKHCVDCGLGGIENLSLIPGAVGAAPVQNIGAYGQEVQHVIEKVKGYNLETNELQVFTAEECRFAYRNSIFKRELKNRFIITSVIFRLAKFPEFILNYALVEDKVKELGDVNLKNIRDAVISIRSSKLPDVTVLGNAGSFFKNPKVEAETAEELQNKHDGMPVYPVGHGKIKLAAGWLIEKAGWKGFRDGDVGVHEKQALVLVNYGKATGQQIFELSEKMRQSVLAKFGVELEREVNCIR